jgi:hypothetical protein
MRTLTLRCVVLTALILSCCAPALKNNPIATTVSTQTPTTAPTAIPTSTATLVPTPTLIPTPTIVPTPENLIFGNTFETIDAYDLYFVKHNLLSASRGDNITGNSIDGWNVVIKKMGIYIGPSQEDEQGNITLTMGYGSKDGKLTKKRVITSRGAVFMILPRSPRIGFLYDPTNSVFVMTSPEGIVKEEAIIIMWVTSSGILLTKNYSNPEWCDGDNTYGYSVNGKLYYWGRESDSNINCPIFKFLKE